MTVSSRTSVAIHALTKLAERGGQTRPSAEIAESLASNPVLVRRILGQLRDAGLVEATEGRHGGWTLARSPSTITLADAYRAMEPGPLLAGHPHEPSAACVVGRHIQRFLGDELDAAALALERRLGETTIADVLDQVLEAERLSS